VKRKYALHLGMEVPVINAQKLSEGRCLRQRPSLNFLVRFFKSKFKQANRHGSSALRITRETGKNYLILFENC